MNIGIIVHSQTGNTLSVAEELKQAFIKSGNSAVIDLITAENEGSYNVNAIQLKNIPVLHEYDTLVFACPVHAFSASPAMRSYLLKIPQQKGKKVYLFVTQGFPYSWMGGTRAIKQMKRLCENKGAETVKAGVINFYRKDKQKQVDYIIKEFTAI